MTSENTRELPDTVDNAAATPGQDMPWKELGLNRQLRTMQARQG